MPSTTKTEDKVEQTKSTEKPKASKPQAPYFGTLGSHADLEKVLEGLDQPVRRNTWAAKVALLAILQGGDATEESIAKAWNASKEPIPGEGGKYHDGDETHVQKTRLQSAQYGSRRALRMLANRGLVRVEDGKVVIRPPLTRFVGQVQAAAPAPRRSSKKGRTARKSA